MIFAVAVVVMVVGFIFIMWGVSHAISKPESIQTSYLAAISGIITEFIGVTFMVIYRSTMTQANQFMDVLELTFKFPFTQTRSRSIIRTPIEGTD